MFNLVLWTLAVGLTPLALSITYQLIAGCGRVSASTPAEDFDGIVGGTQPLRRARFRRIPSGDGSKWGTGRPRWTRADGPEGKRDRPARSRSTSR